MDEFLRELTELSHKHKVYIEGCGCCGSPWVSKFEDKDFSNHHYIMYNLESDADGLSFVTKGDE